MFNIYMMSPGNNPSGLILQFLSVVRISPEWVRSRSPEQVKSSSRTAAFSLWTGMFWDGISFIPDETVIPQ
jgi:hypothetical protein